MSERHEVSEEDIQAWADGRLEASRRAEVEAWLAARPEDAERAEAHRLLNEQLRAHYDAVLREPVPPSLERAARRGARWRSLGLAAAWAALGIALGTMFGWQMRGAQSPAPVAARPETPRIVRGAALAHVTYAPEVRHPVEVGADQEQHLVAWLSKRLGSPLRVPKLDAEGMALVGGRLLPGETGPVAQFMYQCARGRRVTLYVRTEAPDHHETAFRYARENDVRVFYWIDRTFGYALSSADLDRDELLKLANAAYRQLNP